MKVLGKNTSKTKSTFYGNHETEPTVLFTGWEGDIRPGYTGTFVQYHFVPLESNVIFEMEFVYSTVSRGRSSTVIKLADIETNHVYELTPSMIGEFIKMIQDGHITITENNTFVGTFTLVKQGASYAIKPVEITE